MKKENNIARFLIKAQEEERKKIARELHDEVGQVLTAVKINLEILRGKVNSELVSYIDESINLIDKTIEQIRNISLNLRPSLLDNLGLKSAIKWYIEKQKEKSNIKIEYELDFDQEKLDPDYAITIFRIIQESITNIVRHARAKKVFLSIKEEEKNILINIEDDGIGFDVENIWNEVKEGRALGILGIKERVELLRGNLEIESIKGEGTKIKIVFPFQS